MSLNDAQRVRLLATLTDNTNRVQIPNFCTLLYLVIALPACLTFVYTDDSVRPQTEEEQQLYLTLSHLTQRPASTIASRWCEPSLTIHNIQISGPRSASSFTLQPLASDAKWLYIRCHRHPRQRESTNLPTDCPGSRSERCSQISL